MNKEQNRTHQYIDPDPAAILIGIVSVVGSFASIAGYLEQRQQRQSGRIPDEDRKRAELIQRVAEIEGALSEIGGQLNKLGMVLRGAYNANEISEIQHEVLRLGNVKPVFRLAEYNDYVSLHMKISTLSTKVLRATYKAIHLIDELGVNVSERVYLDLKGLQERLNEVLIGNITFVEAYLLQVEIINGARRTADKLREEFGLDPEPFGNNSSRFR